MLGGGWLGGRQGRGRHCWWVSRGGHLSCGAQQAASRAGRGHSLALGAAFLLGAIRGKFPEGGSEKGKWGFQAQKMLELSPGPGGCRVYGKHSQQPAGFRPASSSLPTLQLLLPDDAPIHHRSAQTPPWAGAPHLQENKPTPHPRS